MSKAKKILLIVLIPILLAALLTAVYFIKQRTELANAPEPAEFAASFSEAIFNEVKSGEQPKTQVEKAKSDFEA